METRLIKAYSAAENVAAELQLRMKLMLKANDITDPLEQRALWWFVMEVASYDNIPFPEEIIED